MRESCRLALLLCLLLICSHLFADIADNFMAGGIAFTGSGSFTDNVGNPTTSSDQYNHITVTLSPVVTFYLIDFFAFNISPSFSYASNYTDSGDHIPSLSYGLSIGFSWYPYFDPSHLIVRLPEGGFWIDTNSWVQNPNYPLLLSLGFSVAPTLNQYLAGEYDSGKYNYGGGGWQFNLRLTPSVGIYYFISERYALDIILNPYIILPFNISDSTGSPMNIVPVNDAQLVWSASLGITFFVPWGERSQIRK